MTSHLGLTIGGALREGTTRGSDASAPFKRSLGNFVTSHGLVPILLDVSQIGVLLRLRIRREHRRGQLDCIGSIARSATSGGLTTKGMRLLIF